MEFKYNDGGREAAGYKGKTGDCVTRSIAIVTGLPYQQVYDRLSIGNQQQRKTKRVRNSVGKKSAANGIYTNKKWFKDYMKELGFTWVATMQIGSGCKVHLSTEDMGKGRIICRVTRHYVAVIDRVLNDTYDCSRDGNRCVYGYWSYPDLNYQINILTKEERKIYDSVMSSFPATDPESALNVAWQGGLNFQFIPS